MDQGPRKRIRTVEGSCWPCRNRRVICDLQRPSCRKCQKATVQCNFAPRQLKWQNSLASRGHLAGKTIPVLEAKHLKGLPTELMSATNRDALTYFQQKLWPLLLVGEQTSLAPFDLVLESQPLVLAIIALAVTHRATREDSERERIRCEQARLACISSFRIHLAKGIKEEKQSRAMIMTSIFLCMLDGYLAPQNEMAATNQHQLGAQAVINILGGPNKAIARAKPTELILLSEFASMDLTRALMIGERPYLPPKLWSIFDSKMAWWGDVGGPESPAHIFGVLAQMAIYSLEHAKAEPAVIFDAIQEFELKLQPPRKKVSFEVVGSSKESDLSQDLTYIQAQSLCRAFRHCSLLYLYRAICRLPTRHRVVQQEVHECLEAVCMLSPEDRFQNCALFPICIAGAHSLTAMHREMVVQKLEAVERELNFGNVWLILKSLKSVWEPDGQSGDWADTFKDFNRNLFIL